MDRTDPFWTEDIDILLKPDRLKEFIPTRDQSDSERLNAIARFSIYLGILLSLGYKKIWPLYVAIFGLAFTMFVYENKTEEFSSFRELDPNYLPSDVPCTRPTYENPFMNVDPFEQIDNPTRPEACSLFDTLDENGVIEEVNDKFERNLYKDVSDIFDKRNSQREFYTNPITTIPNKQGEFAEWLYGDMRSCKDNKYDCVPYERLQQKRPIFPFSNENPVVQSEQPLF